MKPHALTMVFGEQTQSQLEVKKVFAKIVSKLNQLKKKSFKKEINKDVMSTTVKASTAINVLRIRPAFGFIIEMMLK